jgi:hypothetical protein
LLAIAVFQPLSAKPKPLPNMRRADPRSAQIGKPDGVARGLQVSRYKVGPFQRSRPSNLLAKDVRRLALLDEVEPGRPQVPLVSKPFSLACRAERLARTRSCPYRTVRRPAGKGQGFGPSADAGEEVALAISGKVAGHDVPDVALVNVAGGNNSVCGELAEPGSGFGVVFVVVDTAHLPTCHFR